MTIVYLALLFPADAASVPILHVDSVTVDTVWNSDSSWLDGLGITQQRVSRDCRISFVLQGEGLAKMFVALSIDSGKTWADLLDSLTALDDALSPLFPAGKKAMITVRVPGGDRPGAVFRMTARQAAPAIEGAPRNTPLGLTAAPTPGQRLDVPLRIRLAGVTSVDGFCPLAKVYWDAAGDGTIDDSTSGADALAWTWHTQVPAGTAGQKREMIVRAVDKNDLSGAPETLTVQFGLQRSIVMKDIPAGTFTMGSAVPADYGAQPPHQVTLSTFKIQETEVTQEQYSAVTGIGPAFFHYDLSCPVVMLSWYDAAKYCNALSLFSGLSAIYDTSTWIADTSKSGYRLPTEAEWEYACRGGTTTAYWWGDDTNGVDSCAWAVFGWSGGGSSTPPVALKKANGYGLFDMAGNVWEWTNDWYGPYSAEAVNNPMGPPNGSHHAYRGGSRVTPIVSLRSAVRNYDFSGPAFSDPTLGFRVVLPAR